MLPPAPLRITLDVLDRVWSGQGTAGEIAAVQRRLREHPELDGYFDDLKTYLGKPPSVRHPQSSPVWDTMQARITSSAAPAPRQIGRVQSAPTTKRPWMPRTAVRIALGVFSTMTCLAIVLGVWHVHRSDTVPGMRTFSTHAAQYASVSLGDGTRATLGPQTRITTTATSRQLTVTVDGTAYFQVTHQSKSPVLVRTRNATIRVLGTAFSVRQYTDESQSQIIVHEGRVGVGRVLSTVDVDGRAVLTAGMQAQVADSGIRVTSGGTPAISVNWADGKLIFNGVPLRDIVNELARVYGAPIRIADSALARQTMAMKVSVNEQPLARVLEFIGVVTDAHSQREGQGFVLVPGRLMQRVPGQAPGHQPLLEPFPEKQYGR